MPPLVMQALLAAVLGAAIVGTGALLMPHDADGPGPIPASVSAP